MTNLMVTEALPQLNSRVLPPSVKAVPRESFSRLLPFSHFNNRSKLVCILGVSMDEIGWWYLCNTGIVPGSQEVISQ